VPGGRLLCAGAVAGGYVFVGEAGVYVFVDEECARAYARVRARAHSAVANK
jgi:hypothetical protein